MHGAAVWDARSSPRRGRGPQLLLFPSLGAVARARVLGGDEMRHRRGVDVFWRRSARAHSRTLSINSSGFLAISVRARAAARLPLKERGTDFQVAALDTGARARARTKE